MRLLSGIAAALTGIVLLVLAALGVRPAAWMGALGGLMLAGGAFQIFEARAGWCALRAMGFKTPL